MANHFDGVSYFLVNLLRDESVWSFHGVLHCAWLQVGKNKLLRSGIDGTTRGLVVSLLVA